MNYVYALLLNGQVVNSIIATPDFITHYNTTDLCNFDTALAFDLSGWYPSIGCTFIAPDQWTDLGGNTYTVAPVSNPE